jgi:RHS repeat-associated protein
MGCASGKGLRLDEETGLYYYGARYYDPRTSIWLSTDPLAEKYPAHNPYVYCLQNPVNIIDPDGPEGIVVSGQPWRASKQGTFFS